MKSNILLFIVEQQYVAFHSILVEIFLMISIHNLTCDAAWNHNHNTYINLPQLSPISPFLSPLDTSWGH